MPEPAEKHYGLTREQIDTFLLLVERGMDRNEAAYAVGAIPATFQKLQVLDLEYRRRMIDALQIANRARFVERNKDMSEEIRQQYLDLVSGGALPVEAAHELGTYQKNFARMANPNSFYYDKEFADAYHKAMAQGHPAFVERLYNLAIKQAEGGSYPALRDLLIVHDENYRQALSTKRVEVGNMDGEAFKLAALNATANLNGEELQLLERLLEKAAASEHPVIEPDLQLVSGDG